MNVQEIFCPTCGAANAADQAVCFACQQKLASIDGDDSAQSVSAPAPGVLLNGRYRIEEVVGRGGFATVYRAEDTEQRRTVAVKVISLKTLSAQEMIDATDSYNREIQFGTALKHTALPNMYDHFMDREHWYIVVEFIHGQTLEEYMQHQPMQRLPLREVLDIGIQLCDVLSYLHSLRPAIIFRDIKPDNIMRTASGRTYLVDFGIARRYRPGSRRDTQALGSPGYAAPEQYGAAQTSERSDLYSLGATLRALLTGVNPLDVTDQETLPANVPTGLTALLDRMQDREPEKRPASAGVVRQQLALIAEEEGIELPGAKPEPKTGRTNVTPAASITTRPYYTKSPTHAAPARRPWRRILVATVSLCALLGVGFGLFSHSVVPTGNPQPTMSTLNLPLVADELTTLDPARAQTSADRQAISMLYAGLVQLDDHMQVQPYLASDWQQDDGTGLTWTFHLRPNLKFSDGQPLTADDIIYSIDRSLDPAITGSLASYALASIANADQRLSGKVPTLIGSSLLAPDKQTVVIKTAQRTAYLPSALTCLCISVVRRSLATDFAQNFFSYSGATSGPFKLADPAKLSSSLSGQNLDMVRNPYYVGKPARLASVSLLSESDQTTAYSDYTSGNLAMAMIPPGEITHVRGQKDFHQVPYLSTTYYEMNYLTRPFDNIQIRQAFALALKAANLVSGLQGSGFPTTHLVPQGQDGYNALLNDPGRNSQQSASEPTTVLAKTLLAEGMEAENIASIAQFPPITFTYSADTTEADAEAAEQAWQNVLGITVQLKETTLTDLYTQQQKSINNPQGLQLWRTSWLADYPDPADWTSLQFAQGSPYNQDNYGQNSSSDVSEQQDVQQLLKRADAAPDSNPSDHAARMKLYQQAEQMLVNDVAWLPIYQDQNSYLLSPQVHGFTLNSMGYVSTGDWATIYLK